MKRFYLMMAAAFLLAFSAMELEAQVITQMGKSGNWTTICDNLQRQHVMSAKKAGDVLLTLKFVYDEEVCSPQSVCVLLSKDNVSQKNFSGSDEIDIDVAPGTYDMYATYYLNEGGIAYVVREQVEVSGDMTVDFDASTATVATYVKSYDENGELMTMDRLISAQAMTLFVLEGFGGLFGVEDDTYAEIPVCMVNPLSDRFTIVNGRNMNMKGGKYYVLKNEWKGSENGEVANDPANLKEVEHTFALSPMSSVNYLEHIGATGNLSDWGMNHVLGCRMYLFYNDPEGLYYACTGGRGAIEIHGPGEEESDNVDPPYEEGSMAQLFIDAPLDNMDQGFTFDVLGTSTIVENYGIDEVEMSMYSLLTETPCVYDNGTEAVYLHSGPEYKLINDDWTFNSNYNLLRNGDEKWLTLFPGSAAFNFTKSQVKIPNGGSVPFLSVKPVRVNKGVRDSYRYVGRNGEFREADFHVVDAKFTVNGELVCDNYQEADNLRRQWMTNAYYMVFDIEFDNQNIIVDGLQGRSHATLHYDMNNDDCTLPTIQALQLRDAENNVNDRFATAADGTLLFAAADFTAQMPHYDGFFTCGDIAQVQVSCSPYGTEEWQELSTQEDPDLYYMPGLGHVYRASLADVAGKGQNGWFDLRIRLEDASGNSMEQTLSPAFRLEDRVDDGIHEQSLSATPVAYYTLEGKRVNAPMKGVNVVKTEDGKTYKVVVK